MKVLQRQCISNIHDRSSASPPGGSPRSRAGPPGCTNSNTLRANNRCFGGRPDPAVRIVHQLGEIVNSGQLQRVKDQAREKPVEHRNSTPARQHTAVGGYVSCARRAQQRHREEAGDDALSPARDSSRAIMSTRSIARPNNMKRYRRHAKASNRPGRQTSPHGPR